MKIGCGNLYITVNYDENGICEVFTNTGRARRLPLPERGHRPAGLHRPALRHGRARASSTSSRASAAPPAIRQPGVPVTSCPDAIARTIEKVMRSQNGSPVPQAVRQMEQELNAAQPPVNETDTMRYCPECGAPVLHEGGCVICRQCGYSKCG